MSFACWRFFGGVLPAVGLLMVCLVMEADATVLPVGPITFGTNNDFDKNFKEPLLGQTPVPANGLTRNAAGYLSTFNLPTSLAVFDTSASGGAGGNGGTGGSDANIDLANFTVSADFASSVPFVGGGFLLRLNSLEANGYAAVIHVGLSQCQFDVFEGASYLSAGVPIFSSIKPLPFGFAVVPNVFYQFKVTVVGSSFLFDFANGTATDSFTDSTPSALIGQVGIVVDTPGPGVTARLDNFQIVAVPEPSSVTLLLLGLVGVGGWVGRSGGQRWRRGPS